MREEKSSFCGALGMDGEGTGPKIGRGSGELVEWITVEGDRYTPGLDLCQSENNSWMTHGS